MNKKIDIIATLNQHLLNPEVLNNLKSYGATIFRINGAHVQPEDLKHYSTEVRKVLGREIKLLVDLPGNKIRTGLLSQPIVLQSGKTFELRANQINYVGFFEHLVVGDEMLANDSLFRFKVESLTSDKAVLLSFTDGLLESNKGIHLIGKSLDLPFLFERDQKLIQKAIEHDFDYVGFSFVRTAEDVVVARKVIENTRLKMIIKVETAPAVKNLSKILDHADEFLIDRGDLSCDIGIENVDRFQKYILKQAKLKGKKVFFATQFLHSMLNNNTPLIAEACGLSDALRIGIDGLQLSEETAVGKYPLEVLKVINVFQDAIRNEKKLLKKTEIKNGIVLWLTGRSGAGKTTISKELIQIIENRLLSTCLIDGDDYREFFNNQSGYSKEERIRNLQNISFTAFQASKNFDVVVVSSLSPYRTLREFARSKIPNFHEIYIDCPQIICQERDPKGHYLKALEGKMESFVGVTEEYEVPENPELVVNTSELTLENAVSKISNYLFYENI